MFGRLRSTSDAPPVTMSSSYSKKEEASRKVSTNSVTASCHSSSSSSSSTSSSSSSTKHHHHHHHHSHPQQQAMDDLLSCPVCLEEYQVDSSGTREPLFLQCHHSICRVCLPRLVKSYSGQQSRFSSKDSAEVPCPECRMVTVVPPGGLTQNFYLVSLIETRKKKAKEQESRLRMWCRECDSVALETCSNHQVVYLAAILANTVESYCNNRKQLTTVLQNRAEKKGTEAQEVQEAVEQLDRAAAALRRRLVARLDQATLAQATANSLLQEIDKMHRRVQSHGKLIEPLSAKTSLEGGDHEGGGVGGPEGVAERKLSPSGKGDSPDVAGVLLSSNLRETRLDLREPNKEDIDLISLDPQTSPSRQAPPVPARAFETNFQPSSATSSPPSSSSSSTRTSPVLTRTLSSTYDHLSCREQESRILLLKECLTSFDKMTLKQEEPSRGEKSGKGKGQGESLSKEALLEMFRRAIEVLDDGC
ncbi:uncharacterized protein LOC125039650 [Penaeus chinensis]|uniref:uncharacterized protein LOC125039650 n=1 Tax=Penaeus chinensis TaxID=139456 RepID=UPI001FB78513|nr:uncharacterized protein LOC125039650 [Penaeus chinensis]